MTAALASSCNGVAPWEQLTLAIFGEMTSGCLRGPMEREGESSDQEGWDCGECFGID